MHLEPRQAMLQYDYQNTLMLSHGSFQALNDTSRCTQLIWDPILARFDSCFLPFIAASPAAVAAIILLGLALRPLFHNLPIWCSKFVPELPEQGDEDSDDDPKRRSYSTSALLVVTGVGIVIQLSAVIFPTLQISEVYPVTCWVAIAVLILLDRPRTAQVSLLALYSSILISQAILIFDGRLETRVRVAQSICAAVLAFGAICIILCMPFRDPALPSENISRVGKAPESTLRSPEDNLNVWRFMTVSWMSPLIALGYSRTLNDGDVWSLGLEFQHRRLHHAFRELRGTVIRRLIQANGFDLMITSILGILELVADFSGPVLLQQLLLSMETPAAPKRAAVVYAALALLVRLIAAQSGVMSLWFGRRCYERSRGEMITMLHEKTLSRQIRGLQSDDLAKTNTSDDTSGSPKDNCSPKVKAKPWRKLWKLPFTAFRFKSTYSHTEAAKQPASMGKILNLLRNDVYEVAQRFWEFQTLIKTPLSFLISIFLIWKLIGWSCLIGMLTVIVAQVLNAIIIRLLLKWERIRRVATDTKLQKTSQFVEALRHLRWYGWQNAWLDQIMDARQKELSIRIITGLWGILISFTNTFSSAMFPVVAFWAYTMLSGQPLRVDITFPALQLFSMLDTSLRDIPGLMTVLLNAYVAIGRIEDFMREPDKVEAQSTRRYTIKQLEMRQASFAWPGASTNVLHDLNLTFGVGLTVIFGEVAAGKTALLQALLGELDQMSGDYARPDEMFGYCSQAPWLQSMSIRENILFSSPYEPERYRTVLDACALTPDLAGFKHGDLSDIGENGIGLSGGQKARVALARAVYSKARILLCDDPISALDYQTAEWIMQRCFGGPLMADRLVILVTHRVELCHGFADQIVEVSEGKATPTSQENLLPKMLKSKPSSKFLADESRKLNEVQEAAAIPEKFLEEEHRAQGGVKFAVYWEYVRAGKLKWWIVSICFISAWRAITVGQRWFLKAWSEAYQTPNLLSIRDLFDNMPSPETNVRPWLIGFLIIAISKSVIMMISQVFMLVIIYCAGKRMFIDVMNRVSHATFRFYDVTPIGRLMNRLTSDISTIDGNISQQFRDVAFSSIDWIASIVVIASVTPVFLVFAFAMTAGFVLIFLRFLPTSQSLRRLEMVSLSPLLSNFGNLLQGLITVRAFCAQHRFQDRVISVTDAFQKMDHFYWSLQAWLMYRFDALSACSTFILTILALYTGTSPGLTAFVLIAASQLVRSTHALCKQYGKLQMDFVSVERIVELLHLEQEKPGVVHPPAWWPSTSGDIVFDNVTIRYADHLDPALRNVSFTIPGGSNTAIIGRTGSGKSTLALALLATVLPETGSILIQDMETATVDVQTLRSRVTFLAQDPVLFPGSMRKNLDPLSQHTDEECSDVLRLIAERHGWTLDTQIDTGGRNLSQGQRQLVGLARAVLRRSAIVILDEATASIDLETSMTIQQILRDEMAGSTIITIAHRLEAVKNATYCIKLGEGQVIAHGPAEEMLGAADINGGSSSSSGK